MKAKGGKDVLNIDKQKVFIVIKFNYGDLFHHRKKYEQYYYCVYEMGDESLGDASVSIKTTFEPYLRKETQNATIEATILNRHDGSMHPWICRAHHLGCCTTS